MSTAQTGPHRCSKAAACGGFRAEGQDPGRRGSVRWRSLFLITVLALLAWGGAPLCAQEDVEALTAQVLRLYQDGRWQEALPLAEQVLRTREAAFGPDHPDTAQSLNNLAELHRCLGDFSRAEPLFLRSLATFERTLGPDHPALLLCMDNLAALYCSQGRYHLAEPLYQRGLTIRERVLGPEHLDTAVSLNNLARVHGSLGQLTSAEAMYLRALSIQEGALGAEHPILSIGLNNLAELYLTKGDYTRAEQACQRALSIREQVLGPGHPDTAMSLTTLAAVHYLRGDYNRAETSYRRALAILEKKPGSEHRLVALVLGRLAELHRVIGDLAGAESMLLRCLAIQEKALGPEHADVATTLSGLAMVRFSLGQYSQAEAQMERSLAIRQKALGPDHPDTGQSLNSLAALYRLQGDYDRAEPLFQRALAISEGALGPDHPSTAVCLNNLGSLYEDEGDFARAEVLYRRALSISEKVLGPDHPGTAIGLNNLACLYRALGDHAQAEALFNRALSIQERALGPGHPDVAHTLDNLAGVCEVSGDAARSEPLFQRALAIRERVLGPRHPDTATSLNNLAALYHSRGDIARAEPLYLRSLAIAEEVWGPEHPDVSIRLNNLAMLYEARGDQARAESLYRRSLAISEKVLGPDHPDTVIRLNNLACLEIVQGHPEAAQDYARRAMAAEEATLANVLSFTSERQRLAYQATLDPYVLPATLGHAEDLARVVLRFKGVVLDSQVEDRKVAEASADPSQRTRVEELRSARLRYSQLTLEIPRDRSSEGLRKRDLEKARWAREVELLEGDLARHAAGLGRARRALSVTVPQVQAALPEGAVLVEFLRHRFYLGQGRFEDRYGAVLLPREGSPRWVVLGRAEDIDRQVRAVVQGSAGRLRAVRLETPGPSSDEILQDQLRALFDALWAPLEKGFPAGTTMVLLSPDGELSFLSWVTLLTPQGQFLAERYDVRFVSSGRDLLEEVEESASSPSMALGDAAFTAPLPPMSGENRGLPSAERRELQDLGFFPLPGTNAELASVESLFRQRGWPLQVARGREASEAWVQSARSPRVLHMATHGFFLPTIQISRPGPGALSAGPQEQVGRVVNPMQRSGLALAGAQTTLAAWMRGETPLAGNDGLLTAEEVGTLDLTGTWLVTLSACDTGRGQSQAGEGVLGLRRGFVQAGARNLLMTFWAVGDQETADFMKEFYEAALAEGDAPTALAQTQLRWLVKLRQDKGLAAAVRLAGPFLLNSRGRPLRPTP